jgi:AraC family transcriptional regulator
MKKSLIGLDHKNAESLRIILPSDPLVSINKENWKNIKYGYHESYGFDVPEHTSKQHGFLIIHKFENQAQRRLGDKVQDEFVKSGDVIFCPAGVPHSIKWEGQAHYSMIFMSAQCFDSSIFETVNPDRIEMLPHFAQPDPMVYAISQTLKMQEGQLVSQFYLDSVAMFLASHVLEKKCSKKFQLMEKDDALSYEKLRQIINYIDLRLDQKLCTDDLSKLLGMSAYHFHRLFTSSVGVSPHQYLIDRRIQKAKKFLKTTKLEISEIAILTGFSTSSHLISTFQRRLSITPEQFRAAL